MFTSPEPINEIRRPEPFSHYSGMLRTTEWVNKDSITSRNTFTAAIDFEPAFSGSPMFLYGVTMLNADRPSVNLEHVGAPAFESGAKLIMDARRENDRIREAELNWMAVDPELDLQTGCASLDGKSMENPVALEWSDAKAEAVATRPVSFARPYKKTPRVLCSFSMFDLGDATGVDGSKGHRIKTYPSNITAEGFDIKVATWDGGSWEVISVTWVAYDPTSPAIAGGVLQSNEQVPTSRPLKWGTDWRTTVNFDPHFERTPQIFLGFNYLNINYRENLDRRFMLRLHCCNIGEKKAVIRVSTQSKTMLCHVGFTWIVVDQIIKETEEGDMSFSQAQQSSEYSGYCDNDDIERYINTHLSFNHG
jgi:hypothetical protein